MSTIPSKPGTDAPPRTRAPSHLIAFLLAAYGLLVIDASLYPFLGWKIPEHTPWSFLSEPWPRYLSAWEIPVNVAGYFPLGLLLSLSLIPRRGAVAVVLISTLAGFAWGFCLESLQCFLPTRIPSNLDIACNTIGAALGAGAGLWLEAAFGLRTRLPRLRTRVFAGGGYSDFGATLMLVWLFAQLNPEIGLLGTSSLNTLRGPESAAHYSATTYFWGETLLTALNLVALCALVRMLTVKLRIGMLTVTILVFASAMLKVAGGTFLLRAPQPWLWFSAPNMIGLALGAALFLLWNLRAPESARWLGVIALIGVQVASSWMPINPYAEVILQPVARGHLSNLNGATWWTAQAWPWLAMLCLLGLSPRTRDTGGLTSAQT